MPGTLQTEQPARHAACLGPAWTKILLSQLGIFVLACLAWESYSVLLGSNVHVVLPETVYRGAQHDPQDLANLVKQHGIRTVINLRGLCNHIPWYVDQAKMVQELGISQEDICFSAGRLPPAQEVRRLVRILDEAERPLFLHCRRGSDRTGVACAMVLLLEPDRSFADARAQLNWRFGHVSLGRPTYLDRFLDLYEEWLGTRMHTPDLFRAWARDEYRGAWCQGRFEELTRVNPPGPVKVGEPISYCVTVRNTSTGSWDFNPHLRSGFHVMYRVRDDKGWPKLEGKSGLVDRTVNPGELFSTTLVIPAEFKPGRYRVTIDMIEEEQGWFYQLGGEPCEEELEIRE